jgi:cellulose synthase/poly-beta-1,6-N-acetylglucosamine synthase-like glycosyltransferase
MFTLLKYMIHISFILAKPLTVMVVVGLRTAVLMIAVIFAALFGALTFGHAIGPIFSANLTAQTHLELFRGMVFTGIDTLDHYLFAIGPIIDQIFSYINSATDYLYILTKPSTRA